MDNLKYLGSGIPLFSDYALFCFIVLIMSYIVYGIFLTVHFYDGGECAKRHAGYCGTGF